MSNKKFFVLFASVLFVLSAIASARADEVAKQPARVEVVYKGEKMEVGAALAICVQTGLRASGMVGNYKVIYSFAMRGVNTSQSRSTLPEMQMIWADTSFMLVDDQDNLVSLYNSQVAGETKEIVGERAENGDGMSPSSKWKFEEVCGELTNTVVKFVPREEVKK